MLTAKTETFTFDVREGFFNNETLKNYYNQRLADYMDGTWGDWI